MILRGAMGWESWIEGLCIFGSSDRGLSEGIGVIHVDAVGLELGLL